MSSGEYWLKDLVQLEQQVLVSGGAPPPADAFTINGHPGPNYNCSNNGNRSLSTPLACPPESCMVAKVSIFIVSDVYKIDVVPGMTYLLRLINAGLNTENFFTIANHKLTIVEADAEYTKPFTTDRVMLGPGQTINVLVTADQPIGKYSMAMGAYMSARGVQFQNISAIAYFQYLGSVPNSLALPAQLPKFNDNLAVKTVMDGLRSLNPVNVPKEIDTNLFYTIGLNVQKCRSKTPQQNCQAPNNGVFAASVNNISFIKPNISLLEAYYEKINGYYTEDFPDAPFKFYDFVNGAPNNIPNDTQSLNGTRIKILEYGTRVQLILQDTGTVSTENHPIHLHGFSFYVVGYGTGNYNPQTANFNLVDPPYMNTIGVPVGGWAAIRFVADNPGTFLGFLPEELMGGLYLSHQLKGFFYCRGLVHALSLGNTSVMGVVYGVHSDEWGRRARDTSSSAGRPAPVLGLLSLPETTRMDCPDLSHQGFFDASVSFMWLKRGEKKL